jgi:ferritin-like metal-binding protein YciE
MKQSKNATKTRKTTASNSRSSIAQHRTGSRQSGSADSRQSGSSGSRQKDSSAGRQANAGEEDNPRANNRSAGRSRQASSAEQDTERQGSFEGESPLEKFFLDQLQDIFYAENKILQSLPKMQAAATTEELKEAFEDHLHQTQRHVRRLEKVFESIDQNAEGKKCEAIEGISREVETIINETEEGTMTRDAALIIAAQKVEHYEIATYGGLVQLAITMQLHDAADLLDKTLVEEEDTDAHLTEIAENSINLRAEHEGSIQPTHSSPIE